MGKELSLGNNDQNLHLQPENRFRINLWLGGCLVVFLIILAFFGPTFAPRDPLQENFLIFLDDTHFTKPPFPAFSVPGFPLGSDEFGRDIFSRLLWSFRPTLTMVLVVASLRLMLGLWIGLISGWSRRFLGQLANTITSLALSVPLLFIALFIIAALGQRYGVWAFITGLILTGWADAARLVRERTRQIRGQPYVEAASALGASQPQNLFNHVLPQIVPLIWTLLSFEISATILVTAELGVLGYFVNAIWIPVGDWTTLRASGTPELGQMLSDLQRQPWGGLAAGLLVFLCILAFNLLGNGLSEAFSIQGTTQRRDNAIMKTSHWIEEQIFNPLAPFRRQLPTIGLFTSLLLIAISGGYFLWQSQVRQLPVQAISIPGSHLWAASHRDGQATLLVPEKGPQQTPKVAWGLRFESGISGSPAVAYGGMIYIGTLDQKIHAIQPDGKIEWSADLPYPPVGSPAIGPSGDIYIADQHGGLSKITPSGNVSVWISGKPKAPSLSGPVVSSDGTIFYATSANLIAVTNLGQEKWRQPLPTFSQTDSLLRLSADGSILVYEAFFIQTSDGSSADYPPPNPLDKIIIGSDQKTYRLNQTSLGEALPSAQASVAGKIVKWDVRTQGTSVRYPRDAGVMADGKIWILYGSGMDYTRLIWLDSQGTMLQSLDTPYRGATTQMIGIDRDQTSYLCGATAAQVGPAGTSGAECVAYSINSPTPLWKLEIDGAPNGGALLENRIYVTTSDGRLTAIDGK